jgi:hypothetical protein
MANKREIKEAIWVRVYIAMIEQMQFEFDDVKRETGCTIVQFEKYSDDVMDMIARKAGLVTAGF